MPRAKATKAETEAAVEEAAVEETEAPKRRRGRPAKAKTKAAEETPKRKRGRPAAETKEVNGSKGRPKDELLYVEKYAPVWDELPEGEKTAIRVSDEISPRGKVQVAAAEFIESRGRKKTTATMVIDALEDVTPNARGVTSHMINKGVLEVVE